jgi:hypothetical protein
MINDFKALALLRTTLLFRAQLRFAIIFWNTLDDEWAIEVGCGLCADVFNLSFPV